MDGGFSAGLVVESSLFRLGFVPVCNDGVVVL